MVLQPSEVDEATEPKPLSEEEKKVIRTHLRNRRQALQKLALEDALGMEAEEQAKAESNVLNDVGGAPFIGKEEQQEKLTSYAADAADALERARRLKEEAEEAQSQAASTVVLAVARVPHPPPPTAMQKQAKQLLESTPSKNRAVVKGLVDAVAADEVAKQQQQAEAEEATARLAKRHANEEALRLAEEAARRGPQALQALAMQQMLDDLHNVRRGGDGPKVAGGVDGALADAMGFVQGR